MTASSSTPTTSKADDLPGLIAAFNSREELFDRLARAQCTANVAENWWFADAGTIEREGWNLSASRYRPKSREAGVHRNPRELLEESQEDVSVILGDLEALAPSTANGIKPSLQPVPPE